MIDEIKELKGKTIYHKTLVNSDGSPQRFKVTSVKTWVRRPDEYLIGLKRGLYEFYKIDKNQLFREFYREE